jgi:hypothetical protein
MRGKIDIIRFGKEENLVVPMAAIHILPTAQSERMDGTLGTTLFLGRLHTLLAMESAPMVIVQKTAEAMVSFSTTRNFCLHAR